MRRTLPLRRFLEEWVEYLERHGHTVSRDEQRLNVLVSCNGRGLLYRWLLRHSTGDSILLTVSDRKDMRRQVRLAHRAGETAYLVAKFEEPDGKVLVMPAEEAVALRRLSSDKGGVPWDC